MRLSLCALLLLLLSPSLAVAAPTITPIGIADNAFIKTNTISATVIGEAPLTVTVNGDPATLDPNAPNVYRRANVALVELNPDDPNDPNSTNTITIVATDPNGPTTRILTNVRYDPIAPVVTITSPEDEDEDTDETQATTEFSALDIEGTATDNDPNAVLSISLRGSPLILTPDENDAFSQRVNLVEGSNVITVRMADRANNVTTRTITVTRTVVCTTPEFPTPVVDPNDAAGVKNFFVDRDDDLPDADLDDPKCDVRPKFRTIPTDPNDAPFQSPVGSCTLRAAVQQANHHPGPDVITLPGVRKIVLTRIGGQEDAADRGDLDITDDTRVIGSTRDSIVIDGRKLGDRVFDVAPGKRLQLLKLTVLNGHAAKLPKGSVLPASEMNGGCVRSRGRLEVNDFAILGCKSDASGGAFSLEDGNSVMTCAIIARSSAKLDGGGIFANETPLSVRNSTVSINSSGNRGGAISMAGDEDELALTLTNDTLSQNKSKVAGGALDMGNAVTTTINNLTFANNSAKAGTSISTTGNATVDFSNTIFGDKSKRACDPASPEPVVSHGGSVEFGDTCHLQSSLDDQPNTDPQLESLATNNGTPTHKLKPTSPAIDHGGTKAACESLDQRDVERGDWPNVGLPSSADAVPPFCDSGALELRTVPPQ